MSWIDKDKTPIMSGHTIEEWRTHQVDMELNKPKDQIDAAKIKKLVIEGINLDYRDEKGYSFGERAGLLLRYDIVIILSDYY